MMKKHRPSRKPPGLMLTSLLDMFTIILIFLIVSFEAESHDFKLDSDVELPESTAEQKLKPAVNMVVTGKGVTVSDQLVVPFENGRPSPAALEAASIPKLVEALKVEHDKKFGQGSDSKPEQPAASADGKPSSEEEEDGAIIVIQSDKHLDYATLYTVLKSAAEAGFFKYRLAILKS
ncbi:MAG: biopolymer transporter ExbD [Myxococcales bacterium]|nr:biopolymer transporter ExbD [Myxococcales bacterium]